MRIYGGEKIVIILMCEQSIVLTVLVCFLLHIFVWWALIGFVYGFIAGLTGDRICF